MHEEPIPLAFFYNLGEELGFLIGREIGRVIGNRAHKAVDCL